MRGAELRANGAASAPQRGPDGHGPRRPIVMAVARRRVDVGDASNPHDNDNYSLSWQEKLLICTMAGLSTLCPA
jgi:hypothetical protein